MPHYLVYEIWTHARMIRADSLSDAYARTYPPPPHADQLILCNWHVCPVDSMIRTMDDRQKETTS